MTLPGLALSEKSGPAGAVTVAEIDVLWVRDPFVPVTLRTYEPGVEPLSVHVVV